MTQERMDAERFLFLYVSPNGGHRECADAVRGALQRFFPGRAETRGMDAITYFYPLLGTLIERTYLEILRLTPQIWDFLYDNPDIEEITRELRQLFSLFNTSKLNTLIEEARPTALVCTHAIPCGVIAEHKRRGTCSLPLVAVVTDYAVHSYWIHPEVDLYLVANEASRRTLLERGIPETKIKAIGIPVDLRFQKRSGKAEARRLLGLDPAKGTVLVMGGSRGLGPIPDLVGELAALRAQVQVLVLAGRNKDLLDRMAPFRKQRNIKIHGFTEEVPTFMEAADLLLTKPGGITSAEALIKGLPMALVQPIPGQEERNARFLLDEGAALSLVEGPERRSFLRQLLSHPEKIEPLSKNALRIARPRAALEAAQALMELAGRRVRQAGPAPADPEAVSA